VQLTQPPALPLPLPLQMTMQLTMQLLLRLQRVCILRVALNAVLQMYCHTQACAG
jgi:hypothetical protein